MFSLYMVVCRGWGVGMKAGGFQGISWQESWELLLSLTGRNWHICNTEYYPEYFPRDSVVFKDPDDDTQKYMTGIDITSPPSLPKPFIIKSGGVCDVIVGDDEENDDGEEYNEENEDEEDDELNTATIASGSENSGGARSQGQACEMGDIGDIFL